MNRVLNPRNEHLQLQHELFSVTLSMAVPYGWFLRTFYFKTFCSDSMLSICLVLTSEFLFISIKIRSLFCKSSFLSLSLSLLILIMITISTWAITATLGPADCGKMNRKLFVKKTAADELWAAVLLFFFCSFQPTLCRGWLTWYGCWLASKWKRCLQKSWLKTWRKYWRKI